jgi:tRNA pseudouridine55 synthase
MIIILDKPKNISSFQFINKYAKENNIKKIGHTGTLDPLATGLMLVATNDDTKLIPYINKKNKTYIATAHFFLDSDTLDNTGKVIKKDIISILKDDIILILQSFLGRQMQIPPIFSAKKMNGQRAYKLARDKKEVILESHSINILKLNLISFDGTNLIFESTVSNGTYIRSLIKDIASKLKTFAIMTDLRRVRIDELNEGHINQVVNPQKIISLKAQPITENELKHLLNGHPIKNIYNIKGKYALTYKDIIVGIGLFEDHIKSKKLFGNKIALILKEKHV